MNKLKLTIPKLEPEFVFTLMENNEVYDWGALDLHIPEIHKSTMGENVTIAILDSGKSEHFEVKNNIANSKNFSNSRGIEDVAGHSTFCSGIIVSEQNGQGIIGMAPKAKILFAKCIDDTGSGSPSALVQGVIWAIEQKADIISISAGMFVDFKPLHDIIKKAVSLNIIVIAAAGNTGTQQFDVAFPARYPEVIGVAAYDRKREIAPYSSRGINVKFAMPGSDVYSTWLQNQYCKMSGTCLTKNVLVYTPNGPISIANLKTGDEVYSMNLDTNAIEPKIVTNHWNRGFKNCKIINTKHTKIEATDNHPILISDDGILKWKRVENIQNGDKIVCANGLPIKAEPKEIKPYETWNVELVNKIVPKYGDIPKINTGVNHSTISGFMSKKHGLNYKFAKPILDYYNIDYKTLLYGNGKKHPKIKIPTIDVNLSYLCGFYLGDGWITKPKRSNGDYNMGSRLYFAKGNRNEINEILLHRFKEVFLFELKTCHKDTQYVCHNTVIADVFEQLCGYDKAKNKHVPSWIYSQPPKIIKAFISGLIDSDGWTIRKNGYSISSCSESLIQGIATLLDYVGGKRGKICFRTRKIQAPNSKSAIISNEYRVCFSFDNLCGSKKSSWQGFEKYSEIKTSTSIRIEKVISIVDIGINEIFDIEVEDNHNFIANNMVVHNSFACPTLAGICALILSKHKSDPNDKTPCNNYLQMIEHLKRYSVPIGDKTSGGFGTVDLEKLIKEDVQ